MNNGILLDSNILIDYLRNYGAAVKFLEKATQPLCISSMTVAELYAGSRNQKEKDILDQFIQAFHISPVDESIAKKAGGYRHQYGKSHHVDLIDAIIAATAILQNFPLATRNKKHFPMIKNFMTCY